MPAYRLRTGWGRSFTRAANEADQQWLRRHPETWFLVWSYPHVVSGLDAFDYRGRSIGPGLRVLGEGDVLPWQGSILEGGIEVAAPMGKPPEIPLWLAKLLGNPRSRKAMAAAREQYEANLRAPSGEGPALQARHEAAKA
jgi:hypothetical protein